MDWDFGTKYTWRRGPQSCHIMLGQRSQRQALLVRVIHRSIRDFALAGI